MEKFVVMAAAIDLAKNDLEILRNRISLDDEIETLELSQLAEQYGTGEKTLHEQIERQLSPGVVINFGKKWVIRKRRFLDYLESKEVTAILGQDEGKASLDDHSENRWSTTKHTGSKVQTASDTPPETPQWSLRPR
jgi:2-succinyl-5-enolpyruvyl-6-hydroxy-3-cyclohexene-1-carboxylate synthase